jgi:hypothetical protein
MSQFKSKGLIRVPQRVELKAESVAGCFWVEPMESGLFRDRSVSASIVNDFEGIESPEDVLQFVRRYGFLRMHDLPARGNRTNGQSLQAIRGKDGWLEESIQTWMGFVNLVKKVHRIARLINRREGTSLDRRHAAHALTDDLLPEFVRRVTLTPMLTWDDNRQVWGLSVGSDTKRGQAYFDGSMSAVVYFLIREILFQDDLPVCSICGGEFDLSPGMRQPPQGRNNYCPVCRGSAAMWRHLKQAQRARLAAQ